MADLVPEGEDGLTVILHGTEPGASVTLWGVADDGTQILWMDDRQEERDSMADLFTHARGAVLLGGLGLGYDVVVLADTPDGPHGTVSEIVVVERDPAVAALVWPHIEAYVAGRVPVSLVMGDVEAPPAEITARRWDTVYLDTLPRPIPAAGVARQRALYTPLLADDGWLACWREAEAE